MGQPAYNIKNPVRDFAVLASNSLLNKPTSIKVGLHPTPTSLLHPTFLPHHYHLHQPKKEKSKTNHHPSSPQPPTTLLITN